MIVSNYFKPTSFHQESSFNLSDYQNVENHSNRNLTMKDRLNKIKSQQITSKNGLIIDNVKSINIKKPTKSINAKSVNLHLKTSSNDEFNQEHNQSQTETITNLNPKNFSSTSTTKTTSRPQTVLKTKASTKKSILNHYDEYTTSKSAHSRQLSANSLTNNVNTSFLSNAYTFPNPFSSNYDLVYKSTPNNHRNAPKVYVDHFKFQNRVNTSLNILDYSLDHQDLDKKSKYETKTTDETEIKLDRLLNTKENHEGNFIHDDNVKLNNFSPVDSAFSVYYLTSNNKETKTPEIKEKPKSSDTNITKNYFLNYRNTIKASDADKPRKPMVMSGKFNKNNDLANNSQSMDCVINGFKKQQRKLKGNEQELLSAYPEKYLESVKVIYVKKWLQEVERAHQIEGKWMETVNKIVFYDD